ncbi:hypothetical protein PYW07_012647 [Mythimna separata]|uniref:C2H2-type domain-containing protein n=1 Tax=Mythimna separata TaxID=271217 RepID=A0AAD7Y8X4_MYTSE|nr:hypothetical protein PYW07_012647 [Mythimna separata]
MGTKAPEQVKKTNKPRPTVKCDVCGRKFLTVSAWKSHYKFLHAKSDSDKRIAFKKQDTARLLKKKLVPVHLLKRVNPPVVKKVEKILEPVKTPDLAVKSPSVTKKAEFECPVCSLKYPVYFTAFRHIQKNHCVDENGEKVAPNSPHLVKPIRIETCASCSQEIRSTIPHDCPQMKATKDQYLCLGCDQVFCGLVLFQHHVKGLHADEAQNYFFPSRKEFEEWKTELQEAISIEFTRLNKQKGKEIYHCSYQTTTSSTATRLCPSSISVREYSRGVHVCYYTEHCEHTVIDIPLESNQYNISLYTRDMDDGKLEASEYNDLYAEFKNVLRTIMVDAAKVDIAMLKDLLGRALEMTAVLKNYYEDDEKSLTTTLITKNLSDDQISKTLDGLKPKSKRKQSFESRSDIEVVKKVKKVPVAIENGMTTRLNRSSSNKSVKFSKSLKLKNEKVTTTQELQELLEEGTSTPPRSAKKRTEDPLKGVLKKGEELQQKIEIKKVEEPARPLLQSPTSFNDSYKHFVNQNFKNVTDKVTEISIPVLKPKATETSTPIKTKSIVTSTPLKTKATETNTPLKSKSTETNTPLKSKSTESSTPSKTKSSVKKKEVVKTKIGQFKVKPSSPKNMSPKSPKIVKEVKQMPLTPLPLKVKPDIKYIVKEQENDCNILILKI